MPDPVTIGAAVSWGVSAVGWVVSPIISKLLNKGFSYLGFDGSEKLKELETKVLQLELTLEAVEEGPHRDRLEKWLKELRSAFYEAEDILDDVEYHRLERQIVSQPDDKLESDAMPPRSRNWVMNKLQAALPKSSQLKKQASGTTSDDAPLNMSKVELKKILEKIENIINEAHKILQLLNLPCHCNVDKRQTVATNPCGAVTTAAPPPVVIGRDEDRDKIIAMLHGTAGDRQLESNNALSYSIIGIHGIPGSGKSTLAQYVCAHEENDLHFDLVMWVHVSQNFSVHIILSEMIEQATGKPCPQFNSLTALQKTLKEELRGKRFLLVLDDVWYNKDVSRQQELQQIVSPLEVGEAGSKILVTSRTLDALLALGAVRYIPISDLDDNVFLKLFMHYALEGARIDNQNRRIFEMIGADIAKKLKRSPLAARTMGGQLRIRPKVEFWRSVRDRDLLNETMGALWWSYHHLDEQVRQCFAYCSIFPRRYLLKRDELVNLWVAEGFIRTTNTGEEMEAVGHGYLDELVSTSFLQLVGGGQDCYTIHDLLRDLVEKVAGSDCFRIVNGWTGEIPRDVRYLFVTTCNRALLAKILKLENLRTLIIDSRTMIEEIEDEDFENMFTRLRKLRILSVKVRRQSSQFSVPASIGQLKHIRYLAIKMGYFFKLILPSTFTKLYHMQVLHFGSCRELVFYPGQDMMSNLINLRHILTLSDLNLPNIVRLTSLQTLPFLPVRKEPGYELRQLRNLNKLRGRLGISGLENVGSKEEALQANLAGKVRLTRLDLKWDLKCSADLEAEILEGLCPPMGLEELVIHGYKGSRYPDWMVGNKNGPKHLQRLDLCDCIRLRAIPDRNEFFVHLRGLALEHCSWDALPDNMEHLTSLKELSILACMNIRSLPTLPQSLEYLNIDRCNDVFTRSCKTIGDPNWQKIEHVPKKDIKWYPSRSPNNNNGLEDTTGECGPVHGISELVLKFLSPSTKWSENQEPLRHPIDVFRHSRIRHELEPFQRRAHDDDGQERDLQSSPTNDISATAIHDAGIHLRKQNNKNVNDIKFVGRTLSLPMLTVNELTESIFTNQIAFERLHVPLGASRTSFPVTAYVFFMSHIITSAEDVSLLVSRGIIRNALGNEHKVVELFMNLSNDLHVYPQNSPLMEVHRRMGKHCQKKWSSWRAHIARTYFRSPWAPISLAGSAFFLLITVFRNIYSLTQHREMAD